MLLLPVVLLKAQIRPVGRGEGTSPLCIRSHTDSMSKGLMAFPLLCELNKWKMGVSSGEETLGFGAGEVH